MKSRMLSLFEFVWKIIIAQGTKTNMAVRDWKVRRWEEQLFLPRCVFLCALQLFQKCFFLLFGSRPRAKPKKEQITRTLALALCGYPRLNSLRALYSIYAIIKRLFNLENCLLFWGIYLFSISFVSRSFYLPFEISCDSFHSSFKTSPVFGLRNLSSFNLYKFFSVNFLLKIRKILEDSQSVSVAL